MNDTKKRWLAWVVCVAIGVGIGVAIGMLAQNPIPGVVIGGALTAIFSLIVIASGAPATPGRGDSSGGASTPVGYAAGDFGGGGDGGVGGGGDGGGAGSVS